METLDPPELKKETLDGHNFQRETLDPQTPKGDPGSSNSKRSLLNPEPTISIPEVIVPSCQKHDKPDTEGKDRLLHVLLP